MGNAARATMCGLLHTCCYVDVCVVCVLCVQVRMKRVTFEKVTPLEGRPHYFTVQLRTQAGTYIKVRCGW